MPKYSLDDIISLEDFESSLLAIAKATEINLCVIDITGKTLIWPVNDSLFCSKARKNDEIRDTCLKCVTHAALESARQRRTMFYKCPCGLIDFTLPIYYKDEVLGAICGGQIKANGSEDFLNYTYKEMPLEDERLKSLYEAMPDVNSDKLPNISDILTKFTDRLTKFGDFTDSAPHIESRTYGHHKLRLALKYIESNYNKNISLKDLSELCCISQSYFSRLFSTTMRISLSKYITKIRIEKAKQLLVDPSKKILAVAYEIGYNDTAYFNRKFKEITKMTPSEYRNLVLN